MPTRPKSLIALSISLCLVAVSLPLQIHFLFGYGLHEWSEIVARLTPLNQTLFFLLLATALALYEGASLALVLVPCLILLVIWNNMIVGSYEINYSSLQTFWASTAFIALNGLILRKDALKVLLNPSLRWWKIPVRKLVSLPLEVLRLNGERFAAKTYNLSVSGMFVPALATSINSENSLSTHFLPSDSEVVLVSFRVGETPVECQAQVVRRSEAKGIYPAGVGIRFVNLDKKAQRRLKQYLRKVPRYEKKESA